MCVCVCVQVTVCRSHMMMSPLVVCQRSFAEVEFSSVLCNAQLLQYSCCMTPDYCSQEPVTVATGTQCC